MKRSVIYEPRGKAGEYAPLALNFIGAAPMAAFTVSPPRPHSRTGRRFMMRHISNHAPGSWRTWKNSPFNGERQA